MKNWLFKGGDNDYNQFVLLYILFAMICVGSVVNITQKPILIHKTNDGSIIIEKLARENDSLKFVLIYRDSVIGTWEDHAIRMKRIAGADDSIKNWSYKEKVVNPIDTKRVTNLSIK